MFYQACKELGWDNVPVTTINLHDMLRGERDENVERKDFLPSEIAAIAKAIKPKIAKESREKKVEAGKKFHKGSNKGKGKFPEPKKEKKKQEKQTRDKVAEYAGVSGKTLEKIEKVVEAAEKEHG